jgi:hypothetical protein
MNETLFCRMVYRNGSASKTRMKQQVVHAETSRSGASGKRTIYRLYNSFDVYTVPGSRVAVKILPVSLVVELLLGRVRMVITGYAWVLFTNVPTGRPASDPGPGHQQRQRQRCRPQPTGSARGSHSDHRLSIQQGMRYCLLNETYGHPSINRQPKRDRYNPSQGVCRFSGKRMKSENGYL